MSPDREEGAVALAERTLGLLDQGAFTATYKYAVLLGLLDLCLENTARTGAPPTSLTTRQLAEKVVELYWPHVVPHPIGAELQEGRCFYCGRVVAGAPEVDHFLPWSRYPDNGLDNLVVADRACNNDKRDFLAASVHVQRWASRPLGSHGLSQLAADLDWEYWPQRSLSVARAIYLRLPEEVRLWSSIGQFAPADRRACESALSSEE